MRVSPTMLTLKLNTYDLPRWVRQEARWKHALASIAHLEDRERKHQAHIAHLEDKVQLSLSNLI